MPPWHLDVQADTNQWLHGSKGWNGDASALVPQNLPKSTSASAQMLCSSTQYVMTCQRFHVKRSLTWMETTCAWNETRILLMLDYRETNLQIVDLNNNVRLVTRAIGFVQKFVLSPT